ncbi:MAG TPA: cyclic nucleotide-binding domain-containing protein [Actinomycetota bacterium]|nr:cyclic nucleotide-binding domain-containing protein [Actinomycetota bacterium]
MANRDVVERLSRVPIFSGCSKKDLQTIARAIKPVQRAAGSVVAIEGEPGVGLFVIDAGEARVTIGGKTINTLGPGDFFGEMALLDGGPRTATVTAKTDLSLFVLTEWVYRGLLTEHPSIAIRTLEAVAARLRRATKNATS